MIDTNIEYCASELMEVVNLFEGATDLRIRHRFNETENKFSNTVSIGVNVYAYGNLVRDINDEIVRKRLIKRYAKLSIYKALSKNLEVLLKNL